MKILGFILLVAFAVGALNLMGDALKLSFDINKWSELWSRRKS